MTRWWRLDGGVPAVGQNDIGRFIREPLDLEYLIPRFDKAGVRFAEVEGTIDLGTDSGRLAARILIAVAKAERELIGVLVNYPPEYLRFLFVREAR